MLYHPLCAKVFFLTHLCFADDLMVFSEASEQSLLDIKHSLDCFYKLSGLRVSFPKSEIFPSYPKKKDFLVLFHTLSRFILQLC